MSVTQIHNITVAVIAGVRPQFTKTAALIWAIGRFNEINTSRRIKTILINTGQHYNEQLAIDLLRDLNLTFDYTIDHTDKTPMAILGKMILEVFHYLSNYSQSEKIDWVIVNGDATSAFAGAFAAARLHIPVVHIEAGMRSGNLAEPEEINRRMIDHISTIHICSSQKAIENLRKEGITSSVYWPGDLSYDYIIHFSQHVPNAHAKLGKFVLATLHKPDNVDSDYTVYNMISALSNYKEHVLFVMHPRTEKRLKELSLLGTSGISFITSQPYSWMLSALKECLFLVTDSGGLQRESYYFGKRCLVRRDSGGWVQLMENDIHYRLPRDYQSILTAFKWMDMKLRNGPYSRLIDEDLIKENASQTFLNLLFN